MICSHIGRTEIKAHHPTFPSKDSSQNEPFEVSIWKACLKWKVVKMVDPIGRIWFEVCGKKNYQRKHSVVFSCQTPPPIDGKDGKVDFPDKDILDIELGA